jgi:hypothetical protein
VEIHKPHAAKNWREFAVEIGTIVVGILIALGLEQVIEAIHDRNVADEAREAVRAEVGENLWWVDQREQDGPCITRRLAEIDAILTRAEQGQAFPIVRHVGTPPAVKLTDLRWEANAQAGRASLFTGDEQRFFDNMYFTTTNFAKYADLEETSWIKLQALQRRDRLTPATTERLRDAWVQASYYNQRLQVIVDRAQPWASALHLTPNNPGDFDTKTMDPALNELCQPIDGSGS